MSHVARHPLQPEDEFLGIRERRTSMISLPMTHRFVVSHQQSLADKSRRGQRLPFLKKRVEHIRDGRVRLEVVETISLVRDSQINAPAGTQNRFEAVEKRDQARHVLDIMASDHAVEPLLDQIAVVLATPDVVHIHDGRCVHVGIGSIVLLQFLRGEGVNILHSCRWPTTDGRMKRSYLQSASLSGASRSEKSSPVRGRSQESRDIGDTNLAV